jgi:uncharacterized membrane protein
MSDQSLSRLEHIISDIMRVGVALSAVALATGLVLLATSTPGAHTALSAGLIILMCIPAARILASFGDALARKDILLAVTTAFVSAVLLWQFLKALR